jgi:diguanylate cyclase (GGDEF)-like protein
MSWRFQEVHGSDRLRVPLLVVVGAAVAALALDGSTVVRILTVATFGGGSAALLWTWIGRLRTGVEESRRLAHTDDLTGLGNRRRLLADLERAIEVGTDRSPSVLAMFDLDGFKSYNDSHGHPAGDALLARLGARLAATFEGSATAYRIGGDEFCLLLHGSPAELESALASALAALTDEQGSIRSSCGFALLPREARDAASALRIVDQRMYAQKDDRRTSTKRQARDLLFAVLDQHAPDLRPHSGWVGELARSVAEQLGVERDAIDDLVLAADLHDIGKVVIPRSILDKQGPLDKSEWEVMHRHTITGEAILNAAPALASVAAIVRSTHERIDGGGYPDGLRGDEITLGARIIAVCDAFDAMTSDRSYRGAVSRAAAIQELEAMSGTQFDPQVIQAARIVLENPSASRPKTALATARRGPDLSPVARIQGLVDVIKLVRMKDDADRLLDEVAYTVGRALGLGTVVVNVYRPEWDDFIVSGVHGNDEARAILLDSTYARAWFDPILDPRFNRRGAYVIPHGTFDWESHLGDRYVPSDPPSPIPNAWQPQDELFVPFRHSDGHVLGIFSVGDPASGLRLSDEELDVLVAVASQTAVLVEAGQASADWERSQTALTELLTVSSRLLEAGSVDEMLGVVCSSIGSALGFDKVMVQLRDQSAGNYRCHAGVGWPAGHPALNTPMAAADIARLLDPEFDSNGCYLLPRDEGAARCTQESVLYRSQLNGCGPNAWDGHWLLVPLRAPDDSTIGVIWVDDPSDRLLPPPRRLQALRLFANLATSALATARLLDQLRQPASTPIDRAA